MNSNNKPNTNHNGESYSFLDQVLAPLPDSIFGVKAAFLKDGNVDKINVSVGAYRDDNGKPWVLPSIIKAEKMIVEANYNKEYLPISGDASMVDFGTKLIYGDNTNVGGVQTVGGTNALRVAAEFLKQFHKSKTVYLTNPTWANHPTIFKSAGFEIGQLRYWNEEKRLLDFENFTKDIENAPDNSILCLHTCCHNPTGIDPTFDQWKALEVVVKKKNHTVIFDTAYQGFGVGLEEDVKGLRYFVSKGHNVIVSQSMSKNMGLYGERAGTVSIKCESEEKAKAVTGRLAKIIRPMISNPPIHPALLVKTILGNEKLKAEWKLDVVAMRKRMADIRVVLRKRLEQLKTPGDWSHITSQKGMFSYTGLTVAQVDYLREKKHIYMLSSGRISLAGLNTANVDRFAQAVNDAVLLK